MGLTAILYNNVLINNAFLEIIQMPHPSARPSMREAMFTLRP